MAMGSLVKIAKTLRTHWKKSTLAVCLTIYGCNYMRNRHKDNLLRRHYCQEALKYGRENIALHQRPRRVTVFLNPAANKGRAKKIFEKTAAPILYLAGIEINIVATEYEGQLKKYMAVLDPKDTDAVVIAGGGGTLLEAVTGLLRQNKEKNLTSIPIGIIPLGGKNRFSKLWFGEDSDEVKTMAEAAFAVVQAVTKKVDVIKFVGEEDKCIYSLIGLEAGAYRDAEDRKTKYWYFGPLKSYWTYLRTVMSKWPATIEACVNYIEATETNMEEEEQDLNVLISKQRWNFVDFLLGRKKKFKVQEQENKEKLEEQEREEENQRVTQDVSTIELTVTNSALGNTNTPFQALQLSIGPSEPKKFEFISEGWSRVKKPNKLTPTTSEGYNSVLVKKIHLDVKEKDKWYNIDGESFEAMPVDISLLKKKLTMFCRPDQAANR
ncbi:acylglycerol kinase mitochondrial isoform X2 [Biomphalaria pfeifferi]|uniref:Acylglycerol kinase, mitochondrial n=1 Tax=Biomphalaria pfeifferi TaxID=112525 RepID=A0AAD8BBX5_BIOPF|nr:acylglycerol kinase mitochondrial isoform X2 [Biomphalaria pfeifferi]